MFVQKQSFWRDLANIIVAVCLFFILERNGIITKEGLQDWKKVCQDTFKNLDKLDEID